MWQPCLTTTSSTSKNVFAAILGGCGQWQHGRLGHYPDSPIAKYLGQIGLTMIQTAYQIHEKLSVILLQQKHPHEPSPLTSASDQNTHTRTSGRHYDASHPVGLGGNMRLVGLGGNTIHGK